ncbi:MAG TPA: alpha/beta hydrolase [Solirubrobacteraceae bacterium]|nr:alpha/beta hydrolase [Solirubrobacteraceae bacterium]
MPDPTDPILLLHGQPGNARDWAAVREAIGTRAVTIAFDRPGWDGRSAPTDLAGNAQAALAVLDAWGAARATVVGHSLGGAIAAWMAAEHPDRVRSLVLAAPSANAASLNRVDRLLARPVVGPALGATVLAGLGVALTAPVLRERIGAGLGLGGPYLKVSGHALIDPRAWHAFAVEQRALIDELPSLEQRVQQISAPTTIVVGTADRIVPPVSALLLAARITGAEVVEIEGASHLLPQQHADRLAAIVVEAARTLD